MGENNYKIPSIWNENSRSGFYPKNIQRYVDNLKGPQYDITKHFKIGRLLGRGAFGCVYQVQCLVTGRERAMKITDRVTIDSSYEQRQRVTEREISLLGVCVHKNIIQLINVYQTPKNIYMIFEICNHTLNSILEKLHTLTEEELRNVVRQVTNALVYLHSSEIAHRDLTLTNILCNTYPGGEIGDSYFWEIKLSDFGLAACRGHPGTTKLFSNCCGTPIYMAPEVLDKVPYDQKCDMFSLGVIMFICLMGQEPFPGVTKREVKWRQIHSNVTLSGSEWSVVPPAVRFIIKNLLVFDPLSRLSSTQLHRHPWTRGQGNIPESALRPKPRKLSKHPNCTSPIISALEECIEEMRTPQERLQAYIDKVTKSSTSMEDESSSPE